MRPIGGVVDIPGVAHAGNRKASSPMSLHNRHLASPVLVALLLVLCGCETTEKKRASVAPPMRATAPTLAQEKPTSIAPKTEEHVVPKADPVEELVRRVEGEYQAGQANYAAGHLEAAKEAF